MISTTVGQLLANRALPSEYRDYTRVIDKKSIGDVLERIAKEKPAVYKQVVEGLYRDGALAAHADGGSFNLDDLEPPPATRAKLEAFREQVRQIVNDRTLQPEQAEAKLREIVPEAAHQFENELFDEALQRGNRLARQVHSGSRGSKADLRALLIGNFAVSDNKNRVVPIPILRGFAQGLSPEEYWGTSYGARKGLAGTKLSVAKAGFISKQLQQAAHRLVVSEEDCGTDGGIVVQGDDKDNVGALLAKPVGDYAPGTPVDSNVLRAAHGKEIVVRSAATCRARSGICAKCAGIRERGTLPEIGDNVGVVAAQAVGERISQVTLGSKHGGGRVQRGHRESKVQGLELFDQLVQVPDSFKEGAVLAELDGLVSAVEDAPQGGRIVTIMGKPHYVPQDLQLQVRAGDTVEAGDVLSEGIPNPGEIVRHKGVGEGRRQFINIYQKALRDNGLNANRRNVEVLARGLINHVRVTEMDGAPNALPDDVMEYGGIEREYMPRYGFKVVRPTMARNMYLEKPALHYTIGTRVTPRVIETLNKHGVSDVVAHADPPGFQPEMVRSMENLMRAPDWQVRLGGSFLSKGLLEAAHRGRTSSIHGDSYIPAIARGLDFGKELGTRGIY